VRLLLVEDSLQLQELLNDALRRAGYEVDAVATVAELLNRVAAIRLSELGRELTTNSIEVLASRVRKALSEGSTGVTVEVVRGIGYRLRSIDEQS
jgi:DNA-binding response OmpR family regulator